MEETGPKNIIYLFKFICLFKKNLIWFELKDSWIILKATLLGQNGLLVNLANRDCLSLTEATFFFSELEY